jgi:nitric oxide reductase NorD protein
MAIHLEEYQELLEELPSAAQEVLRGAWNEAARAFSSRGLDNYLKGAVALHGLGRGEELVVTYIQTMPEVSRAIGEDVLPDVVNFLLGMASKTSGQVLTLIAATSPLAAERLGDEGLFRNYLNVLSIMLAQAPRGLRPMLENLDRLLTQLTLGGLRRWVQWGAQAYKTDFDGQHRYFSLQSPDALSVLQMERKGTLFVDVQRRLNIYLRAMWGRDFFIRPTAGDYESREGLKPYIERYVIHIADAYDDWRPLGDSTPAEGVVSGVEIYRAAANHCAAHLAFSKEPLSMQMLNTTQMAIIETIEDARVEELACRQFPNMRTAWLALHPRRTMASPPRWATCSIAWRAPCSKKTAPIPTPGYSGAWNCSGPNRISPPIRQLEHRRRFGAPARPDPPARIQRTQRRPASALSRRQPHRVGVRGIRRGRGARSDLGAPAAGAQKGLGHGDGERGQQRIRRRRRGRGLGAGDPLLAGSGRQDHQRTGGARAHRRPGALPRVGLPDPARTAELGHRIGTPAQAGGAGEDRADHRGAQTGDLAPQVPHRVHDPQGMQRIRRVEDGDELDINAAVRAMVDIRMGTQPDTRIMMRYKRNLRDLAVMVLLDMSESSNDKVRGQDYSVMDLTRAATVLLSDALDRIGDPFALHGFCSDGRHDVHYYRFKDFDQPYNDLVKARLAAMQGSYSTRMGAAMRHAATFSSSSRRTRRSCSW